MSCTDLFSLTSTRKKIVTSAMLRTLQLDTHHCTLPIHICQSTIYKSISLHFTDDDCYSLRPSILNCLIHGLEKRLKRTEFPLM